MKCPTILPDGRCATSRQPATACPVHGQRRNRTNRTDRTGQRTAEDAAEAAWWLKNRCEHRGDSIGSTGCATCVTKVPAFACSLHGKCTELRRATDAAFRWCGACEDHARTAVGQISDRMGQTLSSRPPGTYPVAIIITCHNYARFLAECVESALATGPADVLIVDDASDDDTPTVADQFSDRGVRYLRVENRSAYRSRLDGLAATSARLIVWLDADDVLPADYLERGVPLLNDPTVGVVYSDMQLFGDRDERWTMPEPGSLNLTQKNHCHAGCIVRRAAIKTTDLPEHLEQRVLEDWNVWRRLKSAGWRFAKSSAVYQYRQHGGGRLAQVDPQQYRVTAGLDHETLTLFVPLSGRAWAWPRFRDWLEAQTWPRDQTRLVLADTSQDARFHALVRRWAEQSKYPDIRVYRHDVAIPGVADADRRDDGTRRVVQTAVAAIYRRAAQEIRTDYAVIVEDDIIPPGDAISRLCDGMNEHTASVSGAYRHRFQPGVVAWHRIGACLERGTGIETVTGNGFGCVLLRSALLRRFPITTDGVTADYDVNWYHHLRSTQWQAKLHWSVECEHLERRGAGPERFVILTQPRTGSTLLCASLAQHPAIQMRGELLNHRQTWTGELSSDGRRRFREVFEPLSDVTHAGCKLMAYQPDIDGPEAWRSTWDELAADPFVKVIVLRRSDQLAQFASWKVANTLGRWGNQDQTDRPVIDVQPDELRWFEQWNQQMLTERLRHLSQHERIDVEYETLCRNWSDEIARIQKFLGVEVQPLEQARRKNENRPLSEVIANHATLNAACAVP